MRDGFIFYRSFYEALEGFDSDTQLQIYKAIAQYSLDFEEPTLTGVAQSVWKLIRPTIKASNTKSQNGMKAKGKQKQSKTEPNQKLNESETLTIKDKRLKIKDNQEYSDRFLRVWDYYQVEQKGDKNKALKSWIKIKGESLDGVELKKVLDYEMSKKFGVRHLVTLLNNYQSSLEAINEDFASDEVDPYAY